MESNRHHSPPSLLTSTHHHQLPLNAHPSTIHHLHQPLQSSKSTIKHAGQGQNVDSATLPTEPPATHSLAFSSSDTQKRKGFVKLTANLFVITVTDQDQDMPPGPKPGSTPRRVSSSLSKVSTPPTTITTTTSARANKSSKPSRIVHIKLSKDHLLKFPHEQLHKKASHIKASPLSTSTIATPDEPVTSTVKPEADPIPASKAGKNSASPVKEAKPETTTSTKAGVKRELDEVEDQDKPKANPRKRPKPDPSKPDGRTAAAKALKSATGITTTATHKLGPKANQGIINAGLRALDRTRKPCRKWDKTGFHVKSFTGRIWELPTWRTPNSRAFGSESESMSNTQSKENSSSNVGSDKSPAVNASMVASSPANGVSTPA